MSMRLGSKGKDEAFRKIYSMGTQCVDGRNFGGHSYI